MLTKLEALAMVTKMLNTGLALEDTVVVFDQATIDKPYGWIFFYNSKKFADTGILHYEICGNGPVIVNKHEGTVLAFGSSIPVEFIIEEYELDLAKRLQKSAKAGLKQRLGRQQKTVPAQPADIDTLSMRAERKIRAWYSR